MVSMYDENLDHCVSCFGIQQLFRARQFMSMDGSGRIILWITFGLMAGSAIGFTVLGAMKPMNMRSHAFVSTGIVSVAAAAYYALATNQGYADIKVSPGSDVTRSIFYARYIDWFFTTPLLLLDILLIAGTSFGTTLWILFCDIAMIVLGLFGAVLPGKFKWGWYGAACFFQVLITYGLLVPGIQATRNRSPTLLKYYGGFAVYLAILWFGYPIVWGLAEGSNTISSDAEAASYAGLDILAKVVFGWAIMLTSGAFHRVQIEEEKRGGAGINPLSTPINDLWGTSGISSSVPAATTHQRHVAESNATPGTDGAV